MAFSNLFEGLQTITYVALTDDAGKLLVVPPPEEVVWNGNQEETPTYATSHLGTRLRAQTFINQADPTLTITWGAKTASVLQSFLGIEFASKTATHYYARTVLADADLAAVTSGQEGFDIGVDQAGANASVLDLTTGKVSTQLTYVSDATFNPAVDTLSWSIAANAAISFSNDIKTANGGAGEYVTFEIPYSKAGAVGTIDSAKTEYSAVIVGVTPDRQVWSTRFARVIVDKASNNEINFNEPGITVVFRQSLSAAIDECNIIDINFINDVRACA